MRKKKEISMENRKDATLELYLVSEGGYSSTETVKISPKQWERLSYIIHNDNWDCQLCNGAGIDIRRNIEGNIILTQVCKCRK